MVRLDLVEMTSREVNQQLKKLIGTEPDIDIDNPHSIHNFATALIGDGKVTVHGSTGFYTGGFLEGPSLIIEGNTGWYTGDNMMAGEIIVQMNTGSNAAPSMVGGNLVIRGNSGSRAGWGMKGGNLVVCGDVGRWTGKMTLGGRIVVLGRIGEGAGESMYNGVIHTLDPGVEEKLGGNVRLIPIEDPEKKELEALFKQYDIAQGVDDFMSIVPAVYGRHDYSLFEPTHTPKSSLPKSQARG
ncbi:MAG: glutamate synthase [Deltaproteobacteria bacterium]|nr:MAG: glutamate synthase [Deltaproteobacteria bacterium]